MLVRVDAAPRTGLLILDAHLVAVGFYLDECAVRLALLLLDRIFILGHHLCFLDRGHAANLVLRHLIVRAFFVFLGRLFGLGDLPLGRLVFVFGDLAIVGTVF